MVPRKASNASNVVGRTQPGTFADQRIEIVSIDTDCLNVFRRKIVVPSWISRQSNWMKTKTLSRLDV
ncbi:hypothetical protein X737_35890 [Mesorhizobium sp. L48C026A00]|nr:hypothetical protein X737_35890 [Mesorhizobium sp. L48C026A00]